MSQLSPTEKKGLLVLFGIIFIGFIFQWSQPYLVKTDLYDYSVQDSIFNSLATDSLVDSPVHSEKEENSKSERAQKTGKTGELAPKSVNINTAPQNELEKLPRIGPAIARNIIEYREENGPFKKIEDLVKVKRIGKKTLELIRPFIFIDDKSG